MVFRAKLRNLYYRCIKRPLYMLKLIMYRRRLPSRVAFIKKKSVIRILFITTEVRGWKGLPLYLKMLDNPRFEPVIGVGTNPKYPEAQYELINYLKQRNFSYYDFNNPNLSIDSVNPDFVIYDGPYEDAYPRNLRFSNNLNQVFLGCDYCINTTKHIVHLDHPWYDYCWQFYVEHEDVAKRKREILGSRARNIKVTGVPIQDELLLPKENFEDPWIDKSGKKRIIYAPHHSFKGVNGDGIEFATFLDYGEVMLEFAEKYSDYITIAFKPHPFLYIRLLKIWGKQRTDSYYQRWSDLQNTQFENGEYLGLFKYSDAIIHDSASFIVEYLYIDKPSMFLLADSNNIDDMFDYVKECYYSHEHGYNKEDIETFIENVIKGVDNKHEQRHNCIIHNLMPPNGATACENIINMILKG